MFSLVPKGWLSVTEPFLRPRRVSDTQTSPTHSLAQDSSNSWVVRSGQQDDQPWPNTKKGYSTSTSTHTLGGAHVQQTELACRDLKKKKAKCKQHYVTLLKHSKYLYCHGMVMLEVKTNKLMHFCNKSWSQSQTVSEFVCFKV